MSRCPPPPRADTSAMTTSGTGCGPATEAAGLAPLDLHELRHTAAARLISEGANALQVKRRMGHEYIRTTYNVHGHLFDDDEDALVERLDPRASVGPEVLGICFSHFG